MNKVFVVFGALLFLTACSPKLIKPTVVDETRGKAIYSDVTLAGLEKGHELYAIKCGKCHKLYAPVSRSEAAWKKILPVMGRKAKLTPEEYKVIEQYVFTMKDATKAEK